ncbi:uncharacterized protein PAC_03660 [Phialocephala subalpina]|uniref:DUF676 domain-containing protein n=1 Tax=Phialocephala subalpina TaxID=576137 RepID=A0A1L7WLY3_9HELO|nr:uncharacterized protein PAC_03660 [Phialocephala subalpina]
MSITVLSEESRSDPGARPKFSLDIIAVHGLNGDPLRTWTEPKSQKLWLRDFLPLDLPGSRVMSFGYNATPAFENTTAGIREHARTLLTTLIEIREESNDDNRPLVFIGHSLGGLVIKQALILAQDETFYMSIYNNLQGVIFFGTPHQGSGLAAYATVLTRIPLILANKPSPKLLEALRRDSDALKKLTDAFRKHHGGKPYNIVTFYETRTMKGMKNLIVERSSALLTPPNEVPTFEEQIPADATHRDMCRFSSRENAIYKTTLRSIKRLHRGEVLTRPRSEYFLVPDTVNPHFTGRLELCGRLEVCLLPSFLARFQQRFILYGLGGSGKTQMLLKFANVHRQKYWGVFFIDASSKERANQSFLDIARACNVKETVEDVKKWLSTKSHWLLLIDNVDDPAIDVSNFFPHGTTGSIIITTRNPDLQKYATVGSSKVGEMTPEDAILLLRKVAAIDNTAHPGESKSALGVVEALEYLALAIIQAGAVIRQGICTLDSFCELYTKHKRELLESGRPNSDKDYHYSVFTTWDISVRQIELMPGDHPKLALDLLRTFSFMNFSDIQESMFERARQLDDYPFDTGILRGSILVQVMPSGWDPIIWRKALAVLFAFSLITVEPSNRLSMHPLVHEWSRVRMTPDEQVQAWKTATVILAMSAPIGLTATTQKQRRALIPHVDAIMAYGINRFHQSGPDLKELSFAGVTFMAIYNEDWQYDKVLNFRKADLKSKESILHPQDLYCLDLKLAIADNMVSSDQFKECMELSQAILEDLAGSGAHERILFTKTRICRCHLGLGEYQKALDACDKIVVEFQNLPIGNEENMLIVRAVMAKAHTCLGNFEEGLRLAKSVFETSREIYGELYSFTAYMAAALATTYECSKQFGKAWALHKQTLALTREIYGQNHLSVCSVLWAMSSFARRCNYSRAWRKKTIPYSEEYLDLLRKPSKDPDENVIDLMGFLADDYFVCAEFVKSRQLFEEALKWTIKIWGEDHEYSTNTRAHVQRARFGIRLRKAAFYAIIVTPFGF